MAKQMFTAAKARALTSFMDKFSKPDEAGQLNSALGIIAQNALRGETDVDLKLGRWRETESPEVLAALRRANYVVSNVSSAHNVFRCTVSWRN